MELHRALDEAEKRERESLRSENARLRALLDERTALLRDMASFRRRIEFAYDNATTADEVKDGVCDVLNDTTDHIRRIAATLKETTCDS